MIQRCLPSPLRPGKWLSASPELPVTFSVATWNINSVRLRIGLVVRYLLDHQPDVLCLQETKCPDANFPFGAFRDAGYPHIAINGQKGYHGVAVV
jgi:exodeoxyribonuclease-3